MGYSQYSESGPWSRDFDPMSEYFLYSVQVVSNLSDSERVHFDFCFVVVLASDVYFVVVDPEGSGSGDVSIGQIEDYSVSGDQLILIVYQILVIE